MRLLLFIFLMGQMLMATMVDSVEVNGVKVPLIYEEEKRLPIVSMQLVFQNSGSIGDVNGSGLAKLCAKLMNEGTKSLDAGGFAKALDERAIHLSAHAGVETMVFEMESLKEEFDRASALLTSLLKEPNLSETALQRVKTMTLGSISRKENDFDYIASTMLNGLLFEKTPLAYPAIGTAQSVEAMALKSVEAFLKSRLALDNAIVVVGGDISPEAAKATVKKILGVLPRSAPETLPYYKSIDLPQAKTLKRETEQAYVYFGSPYHMQVGDSEYYKARVAAFILGTGGFGSRLMEEIRVKRGLAYSAYARVNVNRSHSYFMGYLQTKNESRDEAVATVKEVIADFVKNGVSAQELEQAKKFLLGSEPLRVETLSQRLSRTYMEYYRGEELGNAKIELEKIKALELDSLNAFILSHTEINQLSFAIVTE